MRHHGRAQHRGGQQHRIQAVEPRDQPAGDVRRRRRGDEQAGQEADRDDQQKSGDHPLERPLAAAVLDGQQGQRHHTGDQPAEQQRQVEQQVERDGAADHLGQVGGHRDGLGLQPVASAGPAGRAAARPVPGATLRWPGPAWRTGIAPPRPTRWRPPAPRPAGSRIGRRPAGWPRHCRGRRRQRRRQRPGRACRPGPSNAGPDEARAGRPAPSERGSGRARSTGFTVTWCLITARRVAGPRRVGPAHQRGDRKTCHHRFHGSLLSVTVMVALM